MLRKGNRKPVIVSLASLLFAFIVISSSATSFGNDNKLPKEPTSDNVLYSVQDNSVALPSFTEHALSLTDDIAVKFMVSFPEDPDPSDCYVDFVVSDGERSTMLYSESEKAERPHAVYFSCNISPFELADQITATLHYGGEKNVEDTFSAIRCMQYVRENMSDNTKLLRLVNSLQQYGYYMQQSGWEGVRKSNEAIPFLEPGLVDENIISAKNALKKYTIVKHLNDSGISDTKISLKLDDNKTIINIFVKLEDNVPLISTGYEEVSINGEQYYKFSSEKISPKALGTPYTFLIQTGKGAAVISASAMSNVNLLMNSGMLNHDQMLAMAAYYNYYTAASDYEE